MKVKQFTVSTAQLDAGYYLDIPILQEKVGIFKSNKMLYPIQVLFQNTAGVDLGWIFLGAAEEQEFIDELAAPGAYPYYDLVITPDTQYVSNDNLVRSTKLYLKSQAAAATPITVTFLGYGGKGGR